MAADATFGGTDIGRRISEQRGRLGLSRAEVAERAGLAPDYLAYLESSQGPYPTQATLIRLAAALDTSVGALCGAGLTLPPGQRGAGQHPVLESLTEAECRTLIEPGGVGRILFVEPGRGPVAIPVNYRMDGSDVVFRTAGGGRVVEALLSIPGTTLAAPAGDTEQASVSFDVDHLDEALGEGWSVLLTGTASVISDAAELDRARSLGIEPWAGGDRDSYVRLVVSQVTGRAIRVAG